MVPKRNIPIPTGNRTPSASHFTELFRFILLVVASNPTMRHAKGAEREMK